MIVQDLGLIDYAPALDLQKTQVEAIQEGAEDVLFLCEHTHVYTLGKSANTANLLIQPEYLKKIGAQSYQIERGGDITYHGPGQLVGYPILDLKRLGMGVRSYVEALEESLIQTLTSFGLNTGRIDKLTGIWLLDGFPRKIAAIGIKVSRGVTMHGFALNVSTDLNYFNHIVPCGIPDKGVTTLQLELGMPVNMEDVKQAYMRSFKNCLSS